MEHGAREVYVRKTISARWPLISDYSRPKGAASDKDYVAMFSTTVGPGIRELADKWREEGRFLDSHIFQALALESAEAFAEVLHQQIRQMWGFGDSPNIPTQTYSEPNTGAQGIHSDIPHAPD
ncbi:MAG: hypothetical protein CM1200mP35_09680 [Chloroflexota bacterium]|nr:MAG: hypothetical protein CM1200mP35_09680 [Chloroflexota bacterium]